MDEFQVSRYINNPSKCPFCGGKILANDDIKEKDRICLTRVVCCLECRKRWKEIFYLKLVEEVDNLQNNNKNKANNNKFTYDDKGFFDVVS